MQLSFDDEETSEDKRVMKVSIKVRHEKTTFIIPDLARQEPAQIIKSAAEGQRETDVCIHGN